MARGVESEGFSAVDAKGRSPAVESKSAYPRTKNRQWTNAKQRAAMAFHAVLRARVCVLAPPGGCPGLGPY